MTSIGDGNQERLPGDTEQYTRSPKKQRVRPVRGGPGSSRGAEILRSVSAVCSGKKFWCGGKPGYVGEELARQTRTRLCEALCTIVSRYLNFVQ